MLVEIDLVFDNGLRERGVLKEDGIQHKKTRYVPTSLQILHESGGSGTATVGAAVAGGLLAGGVGALVGGLVGARGKSSVLIETTSGRTLVGVISSARFPELYAYVESFKRNVALESPLHRPTARFPWLLAFVTGPFFFARYGFFAFCLAFLFVGLTVFVGWLALPFAARLLWDGQVNTPPKLGHISPTPQIRHRKAS